MESVVHLIPQQGACCETSKPLKWEAKDISVIKYLLFGYKDCNNYFYMFINM